MGLKMIGTILPTRESLAITEQYYRDTINPARDAEKGKTMRYECIARLTAIGIGYDDALALRRIAMTLHRWHEAECGTDNGGIERDDQTGKPYWVNSHTGHRTPTPDRETGALRRLRDVMTRYPTLTAYVQGDPRGASLYILRPGDVPAGAHTDAYYSRGVAVYQ